MPEYIRLVRFFLFNSLDVFIAEIVTKMCEKTAGRAETEP